MNIIIFYFDGVSQKPSISFPLSYAGACNRHSGLSRQDELSIIPAINQLDCRLCIKISASTAQV